MNLARFALFAMPVMLAAQQPAGVQPQPMQYGARGTRHGGYAI